MIKTVALQPTLEGLENPNRGIQYADRRSLAGLLTPDMLGVDLEIVALIPRATLELAEPERLRTSLINVRPTSHNAVGYPVSGTRTQTFVALNDVEAKAIPRNVERLGENSQRNTRAHRGTIHGQPGHDTALAASKRAQDHTFEQKLGVVNRHIARLDSQAGLLQRFAQTSDGSNRGLSLMGNEVSLRQKFETYRTTILGDMLGALAVQRGWTSVQARTARQTIEARMVAYRTDNEHLDYFQKLTGLLSEYNAAKRSVFSHRAKVLQDELKS